jgi:hypothetical protein
MDKQASITAETETIRGKDNNPYIRLTIDTEMVGKIVYTLTPEEALSIYNVLYKELRLCEMIYTPEDLYQVYTAEELARPYARP